MSPTSRGAEHFGSDGPSPDCTLWKRAAGRPSRSLGSRRPVWDVIAERGISIPRKRRGPSDLMGSTSFTGAGHFGSGSTKRASAEAANGRPPATYRGISIPRLAITSLRDERTIRGRLRARTVSATDPRQTVPCGRGQRAGRRAHWEVAVPYGTLSLREGFQSLGRGEARPTSWVRLLSRVPDTSAAGQPNGRQPKQQTEDHPPPTEGFQSLEEGVAINH